MNESFKILAKHFANKEGLEVIVGGMDIKSNPESKTIYLPENINDEMMDVVLAALLHESFHIRYTNCVQGYHGGLKAKDIVLNCLEDIRLDNRILKKYPNASGLYGNLFKYILKKVDLEKISFEVRVLREMIRSSYANSEFDEFADNDEKTQKFIDDHKQELEDITKEAIKAKKTQHLKPLADKLVDLLFKDKYQQHTKTVNEMEKEFREQTIKNDQAWEEQNKILDQLDKEYTKERELTRKIDNLSNLKINVRNLSAKEEQDLKELRRQRQEECLSLEQTNALRKERDVFIKKQREEEKKLRELSVLKNDALRNLSVKISKDLIDYNKISVSFKNIDSKDLEISNIAVKFSQSLEEHFIEFLKNKKERQIHTEEGKINSYRLPTYHDMSSLFERNPVDKLDKTRVFFLIDRSGSMGDNGRWAKAYEAMVSINKILERSINEGLDLDYSVYSFDDDVHKIKDFDKPLNHDILKDSLIPRGGTSPIHVFKEIEKIDQDKFGTKELVFFITDGGIDGKSIEYVENSLNDHRKWVFLGINIDTNDAFSKKFFGRYNIQQSKDIESVLIRAIEDNI